MKRGPLITVALVVALAFGLLAFNMISDRSDDSAPAAATTAPSAAPTSAPETSAGQTSAPAAVPFPATADYVGTVPLAGGGVMTLSIAVKGDKATAYACDGNTVEAWFQGPAKAGDLQLTGKNGARLTGRHGGAGITGTLLINGKSWEYTAKPVTAPGGMYMYRSATTRTSWIVTGEGMITGVQRAANGLTSPAPTLAPANATAVVDGRTVTVTKVNGDSDVF